MSISAIETSQSAAVYIGSENTTINKAQWFAPDLAKNLPPYPLALQEFLSGPCPMWEGKNAEETHIVVPLFDTLIAGSRGSYKKVPRTLKAIDQLDKDAGGTGFRYIRDLVNSEIGEFPAEKGFCWAVMMKEGLPKISGDTYEVQEECLQLKGYEIPSTVDAATVVLWEKRCTDKSSFSREPLFYIYCKEVVDSRHVIIGADSNEGPEVILPLRWITKDPSLIGVGIRKFQ